MSVTYMNWGAERVSGIEAEGHHDDLMDSVDLELQERGYSVGTFETDNGYHSTRANGKVARPLSIVHYLGWTPGPADLDRGYLACADDVEAQLKEQS